MSSSPARRMSGGSASRCPSRTDASATSAATGVLELAGHVATNRRFCSSAASSRAIVSSSVSAIRLNRFGPLPELVLRRDGHAGRQVVGRDAVTAACLPRPPAPGRGAIARAVTSARPMRIAAATVDQPELVDGRLDLADLMDEVERRPATGWPPAQDERVSPTVVHAYANWPSSTRPRIDAGRPSSSPSRSLRERNVRARRDRRDHLRAALGEGFRQAALDVVERRLGRSWRSGTVTARSKPLAPRLRNAWSCRRPSTKTVALTLEHERGHDDQPDQGGETGADAARSGHRPTGLPCSPRREP